MSQVSFCIVYDLLASANLDTDEEIFRRLSTIDDDGSYEGDETMDSTSSYLRANNPFTPRSAKSNKSAFKARTGKYRASAMRGTGSSPRHNSSKIYDPAMQRNHAYGELSSGPGSIREARSIREAQSCPVFPLRDEPLGLKFVEGDPRRVGEAIYNRSVNADGSVEEDAFCFFHGRREWATAPTLRRIPLSLETEHIRKKAGRELVKWGLCIPVLGWVWLYHVWNGEPGNRIDGELMRWKTGGLVGEIGEEETALAGVVLLWLAISLVGGLLACVAVLAALV